jgi:segregation and condensation protein B
VSRKRGKKAKAAVEAIPDDILAEGSGPVGRVAADAIATVEDVVTTDDIATTEDVVTADDIVATPADPDVAAGDDAAPPGSHEPGREDDEVEGSGNGRGGATRFASGEPVDDPAPGDDESAGGHRADSELDASGGDGEPADGEPGDGEPGDGEPGDGDDDDAAIVFPTSAATMDAVQLKHLVEALIFAADRPLTVQRLRQLTRVGDVRRLEQALAELTEDYRERGLILQQVSGGYQFRTRTQFSAWVQQLIEGRPVRLSRAQLETLAIIAYRQPITRPEIDDIRGVDSSATLKLLIDRMLIRVLGKREEVGRPMLYGTTKEFLDFFSLGDLRELPTLREYSELTAESRKVMSDRLGIGPDGAVASDGGPADPDGDDGDGSGGSDGGGNGGGSGGGGDSGGGPPPGFEDGDGTISDDGGAPASASAADLASAAATFWSAAAAVERSDAAHDRGDDPGVEAELGLHDDPDPDAASVLAEDSQLEAILAEDSELEAALAGASALAAVGADDPELAATGADDLELAAVGADDLELAAVGADDLELAAVGADDLELAAVSAEDPELAAVSTGDPELAAASTDDPELAAVSTDDLELAAVGTDDLELAAVSTDDLELAAVSTDDLELAAVGADDLELAAVSTDDLELAGVGADDLELAAAGTEGSAVEAEAQVLTEDDGRVEADGGWPAGSQRFTVIASIDDRPVERPVMNSPAIEASALEDNHGEVATAAASHVEPAAE